MNVTILHNPRCSKSRAALALLQERGIEPEIVPYLNRPPSVSELKQICRQLGVRARDLIRSGEPEYAMLGLENPDLDESQLLDALHSHPAVLPRPIVLANGRAAIGGLCQYWPLHTRAAVRSLAASNTRTSR